MSGTARRSLRRLGLAALLSLALGLALVAALTWGPHLARDRIARELSELLGRTITIESIESRPWQGQLRVTGFRVAGTAPPDATPLSLKSLDVHLDLTRLPARQVRIVSVDLREPQINVAISEQGQLDLQDLLDRIAALSASPPTPEPSRWTWSVDHLGIQDAALRVQDARAKSRFDLLAINLDAQDLSAQGNQGRMTVSALLQDAALKADLRLASLSEQPRLQARIDMGFIELKRLMPWVPLPPTIQLHSGRLKTALELDYNAQPADAGQLGVAGSLQLEDIGLANGQDDQGLQIPRARIELARSTPLGGLIQVRTLEIDAPRLSSGRHPDGTLTWPVLSGTASPSSARSTSTPAAASASTSATPSAQASAPTSIATPAPSPALVSTPKPVVLGLQIDHIRINEGVVHWHEQALHKPLRLAIGQIELEAKALRIENLDRPEALEFEATLAARIDDQASVQTQARYKSGELDARLSARQVPLATWLPAVLPASGPTLLIAPLDLEGRLRVAGAGASILLEALRLQTPRWRLQQGKDLLAEAQESRVDRLDARWQDGRLDIETLNANLAQLQIAQGQRLPQMVLRAKAKGITSAMDRALPVQANVSLGESGALALRGQLQPAPLRFEGDANLRGLDLTLLQPYADPYLNLVIQDGRAWGTGRLKLTQAPTPRDTLQMTWQGDLSVNGLRSVDKISSEPFVNLGALALPGMRLQWSIPQATDDQVTTSDIALVDFYARVILGADGKLNLGRVLIDPASSSEAPVSLTQDQPATTPPQQAPAAQAQARPEPQSPAASSAPQRQGSGADASQPAAPRIRLGTLRIAGGQVDFTDRFIKPNYSAELKDLQGAITPSRGDLQGPAEVEISGRVDGDTPLEITGRIDPFAAQPTLDLRAVARGFDLPKLSPYSGKWAGYAIEKGKLTATLRYQLSGDRLQAENRLVINQLTFGEKVDSPDAFKIPVQFAISLLKDANGVIDLDLPIAGTLSDPQFSVGGLIWKAIGNLLVKVVAAPFSALASLAQDGLPENELSHLVFEPGSSELDDQDHKRLGALARALKARPELNLDLTGHADPQSDRQTLSEQRLRLLLERNRLPLTTAREKELRAQAQATDDELRELAQQRAQNARRVLRDEHGLANERLFLIAPRLALPDDALPPRRVGFELKRAAD